MNDLRKCSVCHKIKPVVEFSYRKNRGYLYKCKECKFLHDKQYREANKDKISSRMAQYYIDNKKRIDKRNRDWYNNNKDACLERCKNYHHSPIGKSKRKISRAKHMEENPEYYKKKARKSSSRRKSCREWAGTLNLSSINKLEEYNKNYYKTEEFVCEYCEIRIPDYWLEHIKPLSKKGTNSLYNLAVVCKKCNMSKGAKLLEEFAPEKTEYFKERNDIWKRK